MGLNANNIKVGGKEMTPSLSDKVNIEFTEEELELLLVTIKNGLFKGEYVELLYNLTLKIQENFRNLKKQKL